MMTARRNSRTGGTVIMLLVVLLLVGLLMQQTVRSLWILRRSQDQQAKIQQANQLLELGRGLDQQSPQAADSFQKSLPLVIPVGGEYGRLDVIDEAVGGQVRSLWVAKLPVDASGAELPNQTAVVVSCERSR